MSKPRILKTKLASSPRVPPSHSGTKSGQHPTIHDSSCPKSCDPANFRASKPGAKRSRLSTHPPSKAKRTPTQANLFTTLPVGSPERARAKAAFTPRTRHGGELSVGKRKLARPFIAKAPLHLVLKATRARGEWSMLHRKNRSRVTSMVYAYAKRFHVKVYRTTNVGNHLHLLVKAPERKNLADYLRVLAGRVAVTITGAYKGVKRIGRFWDHLTWSRLVSWGRDFFNVREYLIHDYQIEGLSAGAVRRAARNGEIGWFLGELEPGAG